MIEASLNIHPCQKKQSMIPNPHYPGSPARMADGRLFTSFKGRGCSTTEGVSSYEQRQQMIQGGLQLMQTDRAITSWMAARKGVCVDTMVPELSKRVYRWDGPVGTRLAHPAGIGTGRLYLPGRTDLITADPDVLAAATCPFLQGPIPPSQATSTSIPTARAAVLPSRYNRYSAPYGN